MSAKETSKPIVDPGLADVLQTLKQDIFRNMNCVKPGRIQSFDASKKTAAVTILLRRILPSGATVPYPLCVDVPVVTIQGGGGYIQFPIQAGDQGLLFFSDRNIDTWFQTGSAAPPNNARTHDISDAFFLCGINALTSSLDNYVSGKSRWVYNGAEIDLHAGKIKIKNAATDLLTVITGLIDVLKTLQVTGPLSLTPASIAALEAYKTTVGSLLE